MMGIRLNCVYLGGSPAVTRTRSEETGGLLPMLCPASISNPSRRRSYYPSRPGTLFGHDHSHQVGLRRKREPETHQDCSRTLPSVFSVASVVQFDKIGSSEGTACAEITASCSHPLALQP